MQELHSSARASRNSQKCFEIFIAGSIFAQTVDLLILALTVYLYAAFRYSFLILYNSSFKSPVIVTQKRQRVVRVFSVTKGGMLQRPAAHRQMRSGLMSDPGYGDLSTEK